MWIICCYLSCYFGILNYVVPKNLLILFLFSDTLMRNCEVSYSSGLAGILLDSQNSIINYFKIVLYLFSIFMTILLCAH